MHSLLLGPLGAFAHDGCEPCGTSTSMASSPFTEPSLTRNPPAPVPPEPGAWFLARARDALIQLAKLMHLAIAACIRCETHWT